ncbi:MAG: YCF48-related protein, partial [Chitinophagaceae bacterium]
TQCQVISQDTLFLFSSTGKILRTYNGGNTWQSFTSGCGIWSAYFVNSMVGYIACVNSIIKTQDGGATWQVCYSSNTTPKFHAVYFTDVNNGFASREFNKVCRTTNGGTTWTESDVVEEINSFFFVDNLVGYMCGNFGKAYRTVNGGNSWQPVHPAPAFVAVTALYSTFFTNENTGYAVGDRGIIWKTVNGGANWQQYASTYNTFSDVSFPTDSIAYGSSGSNLLKSTDGGNSWQPLANNAVFQPTYYRLNHFFNKDTGIVTAGDFECRVYKTYDGGVTWKWVHSASNQITSLDFVNDQVGYLMTSGGTSSLSRTVNAGETWQVVNQYYTVRKVDFVDAATGYGWADKDLYKTIDSGKTWNKIRTESGDIKSVHFPDLKNGFMAGDFAVFRKTTDSGNTWTTMTFPGGSGSDHLLALKFYDAKTGFMTGENNKIYKTADSGKNWIQYGAAWHCPIIKFTNTNGHVDAYIAGEYGTVLKAPLTNVSIESPSVSNLTDISVSVSARINAYYGGVDSIRFGYGLTTQGTQWLAADPISATNQLVTARADIGGLQPATTYYVWAKLYLNGRFVTGPGTIFTTPIKYIVAGGIPGSCESYPSLNINSSNNNQWLSIRDANGNAVADIKANGNNLGNVSASIFMQDGAIRDTAGFYFLDRNISIKVQNQPLTPVSIKLFIKKSEYDELSQIAAAGISSLGMLKIHKNNMDCSGSIGGAFSELPTTAEAWGNDYVLSAQVSSFSSFYFSKPNVSLPVRLINFNAGRNNKQVALSWQTQAESNSSYFAIERSADGRSFEEIGKVPAAGQSNGLLTYSFTDVSPIDGKNYYRLTIVDKDQHTDYSRIVPVDMRAAGGISLLVNPVKGSLVLNGAQHFRELQVIDVRGKLVKKFTSSPSDVYSVQGLSPGIYYLRCINDVETSVLKFIKQ